MNALVKFLLMQVVRLIALALFMVSVVLCLSMAAVVFMVCMPILMVLATIAFGLEYKVRCL